MQPNPYRANILIVDDRSENLHALESLLKEDDNQIYKASSGTEALELLLKYDFALALLDVQMPDMNGFELAELMRLRQKTKSIPIIFVTAGAIDPKHTFKGYEAGAVDFLYKPLDSRVVRSKVRVFKELDHQRQMINLQMEQLKGALQSREDFISIASHELKTPITSMQLQQQMLLREISSRKGKDSDPERLSKSVNNSVRQLKKLVSLIDELLDVSRIHANKFYVDIERVDLSTLVEETVDGFREQIKNVGCTLDLKVEKGIFSECDAFRTEQVINNLITNVLKYAPGKPLQISLKRKENLAVLEVRDEGEGIPASKLDRIFNRFERIENEKAISGLGLGLYIIKQIMDAQRGSIRVESSVGKGSTFTASLPLAK